MKFEIRLDIFNLLDTVQFTGLNSTVNFASLTDQHDHQPAVQRAGNADAAERIRHHQRRHAPARTLQLVARLTF